MNLQGVLFDLDDTLHDKSATLRAVAAAQFDAAALASVGVARRLWESECLNLNYLRIDKDEVFARLAVRFRLPPDLIAALRQDYDGRVGTLAQPCAGAADLITACRRRGLRIGIVTNGRDTFQRSKIQGMGLVGLIDLVVTSGGYGVKKPDPAIFLACLKGLDLSPAEAAFVGDDFAHDMVPAIALGMRAIWKSDAHSSAVAFSSADLSAVQAYLVDSARPD